MNDLKDFDALEKQVSQSRKDVDKILEIAGLTRCGKLYCDKEENSEKRNRKTFTIFMAGLFLGSLIMYAGVLWATLLGVSA